MDTIFGFAFLTFIIGAFAGMHLGQSFQSNSPWIEFDPNHNQVVKHNIVLLEFYNGHFQLLNLLEDHGEINWHMIKQYQVLS